MKYEDLSFTIKDSKGEDVICDVKKVIPIEEETYVVFTNYFLDENDEFIMYYGKVNEVNEEFQLEVITDETIINKIKEMENDEIVSYVNEQVQENLSLEDEDVFNEQTFVRKNEIGVDIEYSVVGYYNVDGMGLPEYMIYTDFVPEDNEFGIRLFVDRVIDQNNFESTTAEEQEKVLKIYSTEIRRLIGIEG